MYNDRFIHAEPNDEVTSPRRRCRSINSYRFSSRSNRRLQGHPSNQRSVRGLSFSRSKERGSEEHSCTLNGFEITQSAMVTCLGKNIFYLFKEWDIPRDHIWLYTKRNGTCLGKNIFYLFKEWDISRDHTRLYARYDARSSRHARFPSNQTLFEKNT